MSTFFTFPINPLKLS